MPLNLQDNKRPYFKQLNLDETFDEIESFVNGLETNTSEISNVINGLETQIETNADDITTLESAVEALPAAPTTTIVNISSAQILAMGTTPIELLPALPANQYYVGVVYLEQNPLDVADRSNYQNVAGFICTDTQFRDVWGYWQWPGVNGGRMTLQIERGASNYTIGDYPSVNHIYPSGDLLLTTYDSQNPTLANGAWTGEDWRVVIKYEIRTCGVTE